MKLNIPIFDAEMYSFAWFPDTLDARMYLVRIGNNVLCIDPNLNEDGINLIKTWNVEVLTIILTHEHFDHISGINVLRNLAKCRVICSNNCAKAIKDPHKNLSKYAQILCSELSERQIIKDELALEPFRCFADFTFEENLEFLWEGIRVRLYQTPGHSPGSICILFGDKLIFTGDSLIPGIEVVTRLPGGNRKDYKLKTMPFINSLSENLIILPGHFDMDILGKVIKKN